MHKGFYRKILCDFFVSFVSFVSFVPLWFNLGPL